MDSHRLLAWLTILVGLGLAITPWLLRFAANRVAMVDVVAGGVIVALLGLALTYGAERASADRRVPH